MMIAPIAALILGGLAVFALSGGAYVFAVTLWRKKSPPGEEKPPNSQGDEKETPLSAHLRDPLVSRSIAKARERWKAAREAGEIEEVSVVSRRCFLPWRGHGGCPRGIGKLKLRGTLWPSTEPGAGKKPLVALLVHGYTDNAGGTAYLAEEYRKRGAAALQVDCRAHGKSSGRVIGMGYPDARDLLFWARFVGERFGPEAHLVIHGVSMGAAAAMFFSAPPVRPRSKAAQFPVIAGIIADCGFSRLTTQFYNMTFSVLKPGPFHSLAARALLAGMSTVNFFAGGFFFFQAAPAGALKRRRKLKAEPPPLLLFHGQADTLVAPEMLQELALAAGGRNAAARMISQAPHLGSYFYAPELYMNTIFSALETGRAAQPESPAV